MIRSLDHLGILVRDTNEALTFFRDRLGLSVVGSEDVFPARVRLTYLDLGNTLLQLVEPLDEQAPAWQHLQAAGEGLHHIGLEVADVGDALEMFAPGEDYLMGSGKGRPAAFLPGSPPFNVRVEFSECDGSDASSV